MKCVSADEASCSGGKFDLFSSFIHWLIRCLIEATTESFTTQTTTQPQTTASTDTPPFTCSDNGNFPVPGTCGSDYIICIGGVAYPTVIGLFCQYKTKFELIDSFHCRNALVAPHLIRSLSCAFLQEQPLVNVLHLQIQIKS